MFSTIVPILIASMITVSAQLLLKKGVLSMGELQFSFSELVRLVPKILQNVWLMGGMILFGISFLLWIILLSKIPLHIAYPILISINFSMIAAASWLLFHEQLSFFQIAGIVTIVMGIYLLSPKA